MPEGHKAGTVDDTRRVRVERLPPYQAMRRLLRVWLGRPKTHVTGLYPKLWKLRGTPQNRVDWKDPDLWIRERVTGEDRELATAIWTRSGVNPRYIDEHLRLTWIYELLVEGVDGKLVLTERGSDFIDHEFGKAEAFLDEQEGLIELLTIVASAGSAPSPALREPWAAYLRRCSRFQARSTIDGTLLSRLDHLFNRGLVDREGSEYSMTNAGLDYLKRIEASTETLTDSATAQAKWDAYLAAARANHNAIYGVEQYKEDDLGKALKSAREAVLRDDPSWPSRVKEAVRHRLNNIIFHINQAKLAEWMESNAADAKRALTALWAKGDQTPGDRVRSFDAIVPEALCPRTAVGTRLNWASYLMMGIDPNRYPPYQRNMFRTAYLQLDYSHSSADDAGGIYEHALGFLDRLVQEAQKRGMDRPSTRLDAQSVVWFSGKAQPQRPQPPPAPMPSIHPLNTVLYGPPGTGKTWHTVTRAVAIVENRKESEVAGEDRADVKDRFDEYRNARQVEMVTFHQNTTYEDFVEGIRPVLTESGDRSAAASSEHGGARDVQYEMSLGVFRRIAKRAEADPDERYVLIIDEINRGNIARIFGELITLVEDSKRIGQPDGARVTLPGSKTDFGVPANLHVLGTMNTADRSIALLDTALRRRFVFEEMMPDPSHSGIATDVDGVNCGTLLSVMNHRIAVLLDREHQIGHTYFLGVDSLEALASTFRHRIMPLLQEYFYDDWEKIQAVLNDNGFVRTSKPPGDLVQRNLVDADRRVYDLAPANDSRWTATTAYRKIYEKAQADDADLAQDE